MTVAFTAEMGAIVAHVITCCCKNAISLAPKYGAYVDACEALQSIPFALEYYRGKHRRVLPGCTEPEQCTDYPLSVYAIEDLERPAINVNSSNAVDLLRVLGYGQSDELIGGATPEEFRGRVLTALALAPSDEDKPSTQDGNFTYCGRPASYLQSRLADLLALADWCAEHNRPVQWH